MTGSVDELGRAELKMLAGLHSPAERARVQAYVAAARAAHAKVDMERTAKEAAAAARAAKAAMHTADFAALLNHCNALVRVARHCETIWARAQAKAERLERGARQLEAQEQNGPTQGRLL